MLCGRAGAVAGFGHNVCTKRSASDAGTSRLEHYFFCCRDGGDPPVDRESDATIFTLSFERTALLLDVYVYNAAVIFFR